MASIVGLLLAVISLSAMASSGLLISQNDKSAIYVNVTTVSKHGKLMKAWFLTDFKLPQIRQLGSEQYRSMQELVYFNCVERTIAISRVNFFTDEDSSGEVVGRVYIPVDELQFSEVAFDTVEETKLNFVCQQK